MIAEFVTNHVFMCSILLFGMFSVFMQWLMSVSLKSYVKASANMKTTKKKIMINLKNQFETIYGMDYQVRNIAAYVDKYLLKLRFMGISYSAWERFPFLSAGIVTLLAVGMAFYTYTTNASSNLLIEILFSYGGVLACFFVVFHIFGIKGKKQQIQIQLVDYLENYLINRVLRNRETSKELKMLDETMEEAFMRSAASNNELENVMLEAEHVMMEAENQMKEMQALPVKSSEEEIKEMLNLVKEMEQSKNKAEHAKDGEKQIAASEEEEKDKTDIELLEEFVQSFLA